MQKKISQDVKDLQLDIKDMNRDVRKQLILISNLLYQLEAYSGRTIYVHEVKEYLRNQEEKYAIK
jgi:hypothetical protein